jgi:diguanylate cyclase (GGDEF)-like protein
MRSLEDLKLTDVWVNPRHLVSSALLLLRGHGLRVIGVVDGKDLCGLLTLDLAEAVSAEQRVGDVMRPAPAPLPSTLLVLRAAQEFIDRDADCLPVHREGEFAGVVTASMLLRELRRSWDPLTNLGWSDRLREWGADMLKSGKEITLLFVDLDNFGSYNKLHGHIVGDRVLRRVTQILQESIDPQTDILVRYGGDEFVIGSLRTQHQAIEMARALRERAAAAFLDDFQRPVTFSIGISGGRRTKERENVHFAATLDELINAASKQCMAQKQRLAAPQGPTEPLAGLPPIEEIGRV